MSKNRNDASEARREALIEAATESFFSKGYDASSLEEIVSKAGGSKRNIYSHFGGKAGLLGAVVAKMSNELKLRNEMEIIQAGASDSLNAFAIEFLEIIYAPRSIAFWRMMIASGSHNKDAAELFLTNGPHCAQGILVSLLNVLVEAKHLEIDDVENSASDFLAMLRGTSHVECLVGVKEPLSQLQLSEHARATTRRFLQAFTR